MEDAVPFPNSIFEHRLLIFLENESGKFNQVLLTEQQFKAVSDVISKPVSYPKDELKPGMEVVEVDIDAAIELEAEIFDGMESFS